MERCGPLDPTGCPATGAVNCEHPRCDLLLKILSPLSRSIVIFFWFNCSLLVSAQDASSNLAHQFFEQERWQDLVDIPSEKSLHSAESAYERGIALAHLERWGEARTSFLAGGRLAPRDKRFPLELAGVAFKQKKPSQSIVYLHQALRLDPGDAYTHEFLATIYYLRGNTEAAVKYWNRVHKPMLVAVRTDPETRVRPALLDHAFAFAPASVLNLDELYASAARVQSLGIFPVYRFDLVAKDDGDFDNVFRSHELNGWGSTWAEGLLRTFSGLPLQEVTPQYYNLNRSAINLLSMIRWDPDKRRYTFELSMPLAREPRWRVAFDVDVRNENWDVLGSGSVAGASPLLAVNMRREVFRASISRLVGARWKWSLETELSDRDYRNSLALQPLPPQTLAQGFQLKQTARAGYEIWRSPEHRFDLSASGDAQAARLWSTPGQSFEKLQSSILAHWLPLARGDDLETSWQLRAGKTFGNPSFDELFMLGLERDNDLWMHGHIGTRDGRKGSAPMGGDYFLSNWETDKNIYSNGLLTIKLGPLLDTGKISDSSLPAFGSQKWLWDTGAVLKVKVLGVQAGFSYGKDLRSGNNSFYATVGR